MDKVYLIGRDAVPGKFSLVGGESFRAGFVVLPEYLPAGESVPVDIDIDIEGSGCEVDLYGLYLCRAEERVAFNVNVRHLSGGSVSRQMFKGIVGGSADVRFNGLIYVARDAQKTKAYQENHTILLDAGAVVETRPQLEIYADDVECSHGATTGFLNEEELFYMRSRGIPAEEARRLQMISFLAPVTGRLPEEIKEKVYAELSGR